ncbi:MAG: PKD domain-containing protein [Bacteroidales bacterium]|nr:PKD domain-containing protein [Bacteroidales bacterium]MCF8459015.1 PKD domain-containing protein [Bacteroidales bacterium]
MMNRTKDKKFRIGMILLIGLVWVMVSCKQDEPRACFRMSTDYILVDSVVQFMSCSEGANSYLWDFGDSTSSTEASPKHIYSVSDYYDVSLTVEGKGGVFDYTELSIAVYVPAK